MVCTFFGHRDTPQEALQLLEEVITKLIENDDVNTFYVGNNGLYDKYVLSVLRKLKNKYPHITYNIVLAYMPDNNTLYEFNETIYPEEIATVPKRFAIDKRNDWMIKQSDYVVTYIRYTFGGAYKFSEKAKRKNKIVINIYSK